MGWPPFRDTLFTLATERVNEWNDSRQAGNVSLDGVLKRMNSSLQKQWEGRPFPLFITSMLNNGESMNWHLFASLVIRLYSLMNDGGDGKGTGIGL